MTLSQLLALAHQKLSHLPDSALSSEILLAHLLNKSRAFLLAHAEENVPDNIETAYMKLIVRRAAGEPVAYLIGKKEFWSLDLQVNENVLIPRPETEVLIEWVLQHMPHDTPLLVADLGTGSGAIALALANECPRWQLIATDISPAALKVAKDNAKRLQLANIEFKQGDWCEPLAGQEFDFIVSNPPYIDRGDKYIEEHVRQYEPATALFAPNNGFTAIETIIKQASSCLKIDGYLLIEHGFQQAEAVQKLFSQYGYDETFTLQDFNRLERATGGQLKTKG